MIPGLGVWVSVLRNRDGSDVAHEVSGAWHHRADTRTDDSQYLRGRLAVSLARRRGRGAVAHLVTAFAAQLIYLAGIRAMLAAVLAKRPIWLEQASAAGVRTLLGGIGPQWTSSGRLGSRARGRATSGPVRGGRFGGCEGSGLPIVGGDVPKRDRPAGRGGQTARLACHQIPGAHGPHIIGGAPTCCWILRCHTGITLVGCLQSSPPLPAAVGAVAPDSDRSSHRSGVTLSPLNTRAERVPRRRSRSRTCQFWKISVRNLCFHHLQSSILTAAALSL